MVLESEDGQGGESPRFPVVKLFHKSNVLITVGTLQVYPRYPHIFFYYCLLAMQAKEGSGGQKSLPFSGKQAHSIKIFLITQKKLLEDTQIRKILTYILMLILHCLVIVKLKYIL